MLSEANEKNILDFPQISLVKKELGEPALTKFISKTINDLGKLAKLDMDEPSIIATSQMISNEYWGLRTDEIALAFKNGVMGHYGKVYGAINFMVLSEWLQKYYADKDDKRMAEHEINKNSWGNNSQRASDGKSLYEILKGKI